MKRLPLIAVAAAVIVVVAVLLFPILGKNKASSITPVSGYTDGVHYRTVGNAGSSTDEKIQIHEFFWYGCPHCESFEPDVRKYRETLPEDVELIQIPVVWNEATRLHGAVHYLAVEWNAPDQLHDDLFRIFIEMRKEGNLDKHVQEAREIFAKHGIDISDFDTRLYDDNMNLKLEESSRLMKLGRITGTPSLMVDSRWVLENNEEVARAGNFNVVDFLVEQARAVK